ncbi:hypothetical protein TNCV_2520331 [Trichonephila clavipes]|uniref:Mos1 transposase HTH domain-containing protein n=1 Tax=Trichonephila clavipes TaxID=2585209 RepID=A0A8X6RHX0_TRICX|nr:hypothetical protein TNCV_2520331 [Trichonephila clavipes]
MAFVQHRMNIKYCVRLGKSATETCKMLKYVYGRDTLSGTQAFEWHRRFREGKDSVEDNECSERSRTIHIAENIEKVSVVVRKKGLQVMVQIAE